ncbi:3-methyladenine DNA glycosylase [Clarireedia jacksonii]
MQPFKTLQRLQPFTQISSPLSKVLNISSTRYIAMSSRRSARLSAASVKAEQDSHPATTDTSVAKATKTTNRVTTKSASARKARSAVPEDSGSLLPTKASASRKRKAVFEDHSPAPPSGDAPPKKKKTAPKSSKHAASDPPPATPPRTKSKSQTILPPITPTPAAATIMSDPYNPDDNDAHPVPLERLALPLGTNAPLVTPETHRLITRPPLDSISPSKAPAIKLSTTDILSKAVEHLIKIEPKLKPVIDKYPCRIFSPEGLAEEIEPFQALVSGIISQQVSGAAAASIKAKFIALFAPDPTPSNYFPPPSVISSAEIPLLRTAGLSQRKAEYIQGLASAFHSGSLTTEFLFSAPYEEVFSELIKIRGLGRWSVEMFACFALKRLDVFSTGDLGVQRGMARLIGKDVEKLKKGGKGGKWKYMGEKEMEEMAEKFSPYRSIFMWYMWRVEDVEISSLE